MKRAVVVGGSNGIGLAFVNKLLLDEYNEIIIFDKDAPHISNNRIKYIKINLIECDYSVFEQYQDVDTLIITAGFGRATSFETIEIKEIENSFKVNSIATISIIKKYYKKLCGAKNFNCVVMSSISAWVSSPLFSLYGATKAALSRFIESVNIELEKKETNNRILDVSPGSLPGTRFNNGENNISLLTDIVNNVFQKMNDNETLYIPNFNETYKDVIKRYRQNPHVFGLESYEYKKNSGRINNHPQIKIGYLSGTFDLFHIGHLNLLKKAKDYCDYLVVGVHKDASHKGKTTYIPYEERVQILNGIKYVDKVIQSKPEDMDVYTDIKFNYLFVGSDYKGSKRFEKYETFFKDKDVEIVYFPYTKGTSSTQLREKLSNDKREG